MVLIILLQEVLWLELIVKLIQLETVFFLPDLIEVFDRISGCAELDKHLCRFTDNCIPIVL